MSKTFYLLVALFFSLNGLSQPLRYTKTIFEKSDTLKDIEFAKAEWLNNPIGGLLADYQAHEGENLTESRPLYMDIFQPRGDTLKERPAILFAHSGGFIIGSRHNEDMVALCDSFARRGYVTATFDYRLGIAAKVTRIFGVMIGLTVTEENGTRAVYRGIQDGRAAIRFLKHNAQTYGIDTTKIYMVGSSAGAFVALHNLYLNKNSEIPEAALSKPNLGNLDTVGILGYGAQADAIVSMWGAIDSTHLIEDNSTPVLLIHGEDDDIVPFKKGMPLKTLVPDNNAIDFTMPETFGSFCIDSALTNRNIPNETYFVKAQKHEFYGVATGAFGDDGANVYYDTIQQKISTFFFERFRPNADFNFEIDTRTLFLSNTTENIFSSEWEIDDLIISNERNTSFTFDNTGTFKVRLRTCNKNMACDTLTKMITIDTPVSVKHFQNEVKVYPNPASKLIHFSGANSYADIFIYNSVGKLVKFSEQNLDESLSIEEFKSGIYFIKIHSNENIYFQKLLKTE